MSAKIDSKKLKQRGKDDFARGLDLEDNPFLFHSNPAKSGWWEAGWIEAKKEVTDNCV